MRPFKCWVTHYYQIMLSLSKYGLSECVQNHDFWSFNLNISVKYGHFFENTRHLYEKNEFTLGSFFFGGGGVHGKVCWLLA